MEIKNKVIVITGASSGMGAATAKLLAENGAKVVLGARREERLRILAEQLPEGSGVYRKTDVADLNEVNELVQLAVDHFGKLDAIYNNAGIMPVAKLSELHVEEWRNMLNINIMGVLNGIAAALPIMKKQGFGHILATDSIAGHLVMPEYAVYAGTKHAVRVIMEGLRLEEHSNHIRTTIISPGGVSSELYLSISDEKKAQEMKKHWQEPGYALSSNDIAQAVLYAIGVPENVNVNEILIRPTSQTL